MNDTIHYWFRLHERALPPTTYTRTSLFSLLWKLSGHTTKRDNKIQFVQSPCVAIAKINQQDVVYASQQKMLPFVTAPAAPTPTLSLPWKYFFACRWHFPPYMDRGVNVGWIVYFSGRQVKLSLLVVIGRAGWESIDGWGPCVLGACTLSSVMAWRWLLPQYCIPISNFSL